MSELFTMRYSGHRLLVTTDSGSADHIEVINLAKGLSVKIEHEQS